MKRYSLQYTSDEYNRFSNRDPYDHFYGYASTIAGAKKYISRIKKSYLHRENPRNFRIYDHEADIDPSTGYVPCVYQQEV
jgi:hypothetical protein